MAETVFYVAIAWLLIASLAIAFAVIGVYSSEREADEDE